MTRKLTFLRFLQSREEGNSSIEGKRRLFLECLSSLPQAVTNSIIYEATTKDPEYIATAAAKDYPRCYTLLLAAFNLRHVPTPKSPVFTNLEDPRLFEFLTEYETKRNREVRPPAHNPRDDSWSYTIPYMANIYLAGQHSDRGFIVDTAFAMLRRARAEQNRALCPNYLYDQSNISQAIYNEKLQLAKGINTVLLELDTYRAETQAPPQEQRSRENTILMLFRNIFPTEANRGAAQRFYPNFSTKLLQHRDLEYTYLVFSLFSQAQLTTILENHATLIQETALNALLLCYNKFSQVLPERVRDAGLFENQWRAISGENKINQDDPSVPGIAGNPPDPKRRRVR